MLGPFKSVIARIYCIYVGRIPSKARPGTANETVIGVAAAITAAVAASVAAVVAAAVAAAVAAPSKGPGF